MKALVEQVKAGEQGAAEVLLDYLLEQSVEHTAAVAFITSLTLGAAPAVWPGRLGTIQTIQPWTFFDTILVHGAVGSRHRFFRDLPSAPFPGTNVIKQDGHTNLHQPQRIYSYTTFKVSRITLESPALPADSLVFMRINQFEILNTHAAALQACSFWGAPTFIDISDRDDLYAYTQLGSHVLEPLMVRLTLHGWLARPLGA